MKTEGFYKLTIDERRKRLLEDGLLTKDDLALLDHSLKLDVADKMIENVIGTFPLPYALAMNFKINGKERLIPMVLEEPSVVAAASNAAKLSLPAGFTAASTAPMMIGQIQVVKLKEPKKALDAVMQEKQKLIEMANTRDSTLVKLGGGAKGIEGYLISTARGKMLILHVLVDVRDAMGANAVNSICEHISPEIMKITGGEVRLRILSNLAIHRLVKAKAIWKKELIGEEAMEKILDAYEFAANDQFRCTTNNKGIMNGIGAVCIATGNDFRALEAGAHSYASISGKYLPLAKYQKNNEGDLVGTIELPLAVGIVGGATKTLPLAQLSLKIMQIKSANELAEIMACVGLANNFAALRALATEGINRGHMELHARNVAIAAGAKGTDIERIAEQIAKEKNVRVERAKELLGKKG